MPHGQLPPDMLLSQPASVAQHCTREDKHAGRRQEDSRAIYTRPSSYLRQINVVPSDGSSLHGGRSCTHCRGRLFSSEAPSRAGVPLVTAWDHGIELSLSKETAPWPSGDRSRPSRRATSACHATVAWSRLDSKERYRQHSTGSSEGGPQNRLQARRSAHSSALNCMPTADRLCCKGIVVEKTHFFVSHPSLSHSHRALRACSRAGGVDVCFCGPSRRASRRPNARVASLPRSVSVASLPCPAIAYVLDAPICGARGGSLPQLRLAHTRSAKC